MTTLGVGGIGVGGIGVGGIGVGGIGVGGIGVGGIGEIVALGSGVAMGVFKLLIISAIRLSILISSGSLSRIMSLIMSNDIGLNFR